MNNFNKIRNKIDSIINKYYLSPEQYARKIGVIVGKGCNISTKNFSSEPYLIKIGNNVRIARHVQLLTHGGLWSLRNTDVRYEKLDYFGRIKIQDDVYIGQGAIIMPGVTIENNCIIGASSVVTKSVPRDSVVAGNPARIVATMNEFIENIMKYDTGLYDKSPIEKEELINALSDDLFVKKPFLKKQ